MSGYYASEGRISTDPIAGGIAITETQYRDALEAMLDGRLVSVDDGALALRDPPPPPGRPEPPPDTPEVIHARYVASVIAERGRRLALGFDYDFGDARGLHRIGTTPMDMVGWDEVTTLAGALIAVGNDQEPIDIVTDTGPIIVTAREWQDVLLAAGAARQGLWAASFALQVMDPPADDVTDDLYWPQQD